MGKNAHKQSETRKKRKQRSILEMISAPPSPFPRPGLQKSAAIPQPLAAGDLFSVSLSVCFCYLVKQYFLPEHLPIEGMRRAEKE